MCDEKLWNGSLQIGNIFKIISEFRIKSCWMYPWNKLTSGVTLQCILGMTIVTSHFCFQLWWVCTAINFESNLGYFLAVEQVGTVLYLCMLEFLAVKHVGTVYTYECYVSKPPTCQMLKFWFYMYCPMMIASLP